PRAPPTPRAPAAARSPARTCAARCRAGRRESRSGAAPGRRARPRTAHRRTAPPRSAPCAAPGRAGTSLRRAIPDRRRPGALLDYRLHERERRLVAAAGRPALGVRDLVRIAGIGHRGQVLLAPVEVQRIDPDALPAPVGAVAAHRLLEHANVIERRLLRPEVLVLPYGAEVLGPGLRLTTVTSSCRCRTPACLDCPSRPRRGTP